MRVKQDPARAAWRDLATLHADAFAPLLVAGALVSEDRTPGHGPDKGRVELPHPFAQEDYCPCGADLFVQAQFWQMGRLWRLTRCAESECEHVGVVSVPASEALPEGAAVVGNSAWQFTPWMFLPGPELPQWEAHPVIIDLAGALEQDGGEAFHQALAEQLDAFVGEYHPRGCPSRVGGVGDFIQWPHTPTCDTCGTHMPLLVQLGYDAGFHWADAGQLYVFACSAHPDQTRAFQDTH